MRKVKGRLGKTLVVVTGRIDVSGMLRFKLTVHSKPQLGSHWIDR